MVVVMILECHQTVVYLEILNDFSKLYSPDAAVCNAVDRAMGESVRSNTRTIVMSISGRASYFVS